MSDGSGNYGNNENCVVQANADFVVSARAFAVDVHDRITIHGSQQRRPANAPTGVTMSSGDKLYWSSDGSVVASGFEICATIPVPMPMAPPNPPSTPFGAIFYSFDTDNGLSSGWSTGPTLGNGAALSQPYGWARRSGGTPSGRTGPATAQGGSGRYYYTESSSPRQPGDTFILSYDGSACGANSIIHSIDFSYHMYGAHIGSLKVIASDGGVRWERNGQQSTTQAQAGWLQASGVSIGQVGFAFHGVRGPSWQGDIAIDSVNVICGATNPPSAPDPPFPPMPPSPPPRPPRCVNQFNLALVLDRSGSMGGEMQNLKALAIELLDQLELGVGRAAVVAFSSTAEVLVPLSHSHSDLYAAINTLSAGGGTQIDAGLLAAQGALNSTNAGDGIQESVVWLMSDGVQSGAAGDRTAIELRTAYAQQASPSSPSASAARLLRLSTRWRANRRSCIPSWALIWTRSVHASPTFARLPPRRANRRRR